MTPDKLAVILFDGQLLLKPLIDTGDPLTSIVNAESAEIVQLMVSLNVISTCVPDDNTVAEAIVGRVTSTAELFVTARAVNDTASLPAVSWIAALEVPASTAGASYATVTTFSLETAFANVSTTVEMDPFAATDATVAGEPSTKTVNALAGARGSRNTSL
ncbi:unannotated protein [freshwater metagenome]|uniref:Unannotated protein n=1 Tax=freshwater metagenome TaxID=449393 RepID=A0A6J6HE34_9ZZZZ